MSDKGPFRPYPWPLNHARIAVRTLRLHAVALRSRGRFKYGSHVTVATGSDIRPPHLFEVGDHVSIGKNFTCEVDARVASHVLISSNVSFVGRDHPFEDSSITIYEATRVDTSSVTIGSDVLVGFGTIVVGTVNVGNGCIVGAGSVVVQDLPPFTVCAGIPAKVIRPRFPTENV